MYFILFFFFFCCCSIRYNLNIRYSFVQRKKIKLQQGSPFFSFSQFSGFFVKTTVFDFFFLPSIIVHIYIYIRYYW